PPRPPTSTPFPYTTLFRSEVHNALAAADPEIAALVQQEERRQAQTVKLIPSENYVSRAVLEASGTVLTNKYSEGYPGRRYYEGRSEEHTSELQSRSDLVCR